MPSRQLILLLAASGLAACGGGPEGPPQGPPSVTVSKPVVADLTLWDDYTGRLAAVDRVEVRARVSGYLYEVLFDEGAIVDSGQTLFVIDQRPFLAALDRAKADLRASEVRLDLAQNDLDRANRLYASRAISEEELDARRQDLRAARAAVDAAQAAVTQAELELEFTEIKSPVRGRADRARVTRGNLVSGGTAGSTHLTTIVSTDPMYVYFTADEADYLRYVRLDRAGRRPSSRDAANPVRLRLSDEETFGRVGYMDFVSAEVDESSGTVQGRAVFDNPDGVLTPGLFVDIQLLGETLEDALLVPNDAILADQAERFVYVVDADGNASRRNVELGRTQGELRIVESGLEAGDTVVVSGLQRVRPGEPVTPEETTLSAPENAVQNLASGESP